MWGEDAGRAERVRCGSVGQVKMLTNPRLLGEESREAVWSHLHLQGIIWVTRTGRQAMSLLHMSQQKVMFEVQLDLVAPLSAANAENLANQGLK